MQQERLSHLALQTVHYAPVRVLASLTEFVRPQLGRATPQPLVALATALVASLSVVSISHSASALPADASAFRALALALGLLATLLISYRYPIHMGRSTKIYLMNVPLFLIVVWFAPFLAAVVAAVSVAIGELLVRKDRKNYYSDVVTSTARVTLMVILAASLCHCTQLRDLYGPVVLLLTALAMWGCDAVSTPLLIAPMVKERPFRVFLTVVRQSMALEGAQYLLAVLAALAVASHPMALLLLVAPLILVYRHFKRTRELHESTRRLLEDLADAVDRRDVYTGDHSRRVALLAGEILRALGTEGLEAEIIVSAARVHDIGKIHVPDGVLQKAGRLSEEEWAVLRTHPDCGADMLQRHTTFVRGVEMVRHHHEAWDGSGYPLGLRGTAIPFGARVIAVADSYDAMTSSRPYREGMPSPQAIARLRHGSGAQWDPEIVEALVSALPELLARTPLAYPRPAPLPLQSSQLQIAQ